MSQSPETIPVLLEMLMLLGEEADHVQEKYAGFTSEEIHPLLVCSPAPSICCSIGRRYNRRAGRRHAARNCMCTCAFTHLCEIYRFRHAGMHAQYSCLDDRVYKYICAPVSFILWRQKEFHVPRSQLQSCMCVYGHLYVFILGIFSFIYACIRNIHKTCASLNHTMSYVHA